MEHIRFIRKPSLAMYPGIIVNKDTKLEFKTDRVAQRLENLVFTSVTSVSGDGYESTYNTTIYLNEGDVLIYDGEERGYVKPVEAFVTILDALEDLENIRDLG